MGSHLVTNRFIRMTSIEQQALLLCALQIASMYGIRTCQY